MITKKTVIFVLPVLFTLFMSGCDNLFFEGGDARNVPADETPATEIPEGFGAARFDVLQGLGPERSPVPAVVLNNLFLEYWFAKDEGTPEAKTPEAGSAFILEPGEYTLTVKAYVDAEKTKQAAGGTAEFTVTAGVMTAPVALTLSPIVEGEGTGSLEFSLTYPAAATVETFTLTLIAGGTGPINLKGAGNASGGEPARRREGGHPCGLLPAAGDVEFRRRRNGQGRGGTHLPEPERPGGLYLC